MDLAEIAKRVDEIRRIAEGTDTYPDSEAAHVTEDALYRDVLRAIADGAASAPELAAAALEAAALDYLTVVRMTEDDLSAPPLVQVPPSRASDVAWLEALFPIGWQFGTVWQSAGSRPDARNLTARRLSDGVFLAAPDAPALAEKIRHEEATG